MSNIGREYLENVYIDYDREDKEQNSVKKEELTREQLIEILCNMYSTLDKNELGRMSTEELKEMKEQMDKIQERTYFKHYGNNERARLYEHQDDDYEEENTNGLGR